jgi:hypothetical protein
MPRPAATASTHEKLVYADMQCSMYLGNANEAAERGDQAKADRLYHKSQYWLDQYNRLNGNA